jgi:hypothetical protein
MNNICRHFVFFGCVLVCAMGIAVRGDAGFVSPTKIFIDSGRNAASVSIANIENEPMVYTFEWERRARTPDGKSTHLLQDGESYGKYRPADPYLIYSPRRVVIEPGETQRVRIFARRPKGMPDGEYRSHLKISSESVKPAEKTKAGLGGIGGVMSIHPAMSIPVMLRTGKTEIDIEVVKSQIVKEGAVDVLHLDIVNKSTRSIYGRSRFECSVPGASEPVSVQSNGFKLYYETETFHERFSVPEEINISQCTSLIVKLFSVRDLEYGKEPIAVVKLK